MTISQFCTFAYPASSTFAYIDKYIGEGKTSGWLVSFSPRALTWLGRSALPLRVLAWLGWLAFVYLAYHASSILYQEEKCFIEYSLMQLSATWSNIKDIILNALSSYKETLPGASSWRNKSNHSSKVPLSTMDSHENHFILNQLNNLIIHHLTVSLQSQSVSWQKESTPHDWCWIG